MILPLNVTRVSISLRSSTLSLRSVVSNARQPPAIEPLGASSCRRMLFLRAGLLSEAFDALYT